MNAFWEIGWSGAGAPCRPQRTQADPGSTIRACLCTTDLCNDVDQDEDDKDDEDEVIDPARDEGTPTEKMFPLRSSLVDTVQSILCLSFVLRVCPCLLSRVAIVSFQVRHFRTVLLVHLPYPVL